MSERHSTRNLDPGDVAIVEDLIRTRRDRVYPLTVDALNRRSQLPIDANTLSIVILATVGHFPDAPAAVDLLARMDIDDRITFVVSIAAERFPAVTMRGGAA